MSFFDAMNHALTTMSTGGFSTKNASMAYFDRSLDPVYCHPIYVSGRHQFTLICILPSKVNSREFGPVMNSGLI
jgi:hypothetical protein